MRKILSTIAAMLITGSLFAGGLVTNTNQSAMFTRLQNRNASTSIDAVYYNPAGLTKLGTGLFVSINNQTISQTKTVLNNYQFLSGTPKEYVGEVSAPIFPGVYAAFNAGKFSFSAGFNPIGGGGGATYDKGLPSFEMDIATLKPLLTGMGLTTSQYSADIYFEGTSIYFGYQANVAYELNDMISVAAGVRYVTAKNTYNGSISNIMINPTHPLINPTSAMISAPVFFTTINQPVYAAMTSDREVDVEETGSGIAPILSVNISPLDMLNVAVKYEFATELEMTTTVSDNKSGGIFVDGSTYKADMPAMLAFGAELRPIDRLMVTASLNTFFDKNLDTKAINENTIDKNFLEYGLGAEFGLTDKLRVSAGWVSTVTGVNDNYQSDQTYSTNTNSIGAGFGFRITDMIDVNVGGQYTFYDDDVKSFSRNLSQTVVIPVAETYSKKTWIIGVGLDLNFGL
jgi:long-chain fatty acid transport protein